MKVLQPQHDGHRLSNFSLWVAFFLAPAAWSFHLVFIYATADQVCKESLSKTALHAVSIGCLAASIIGGLLGMALWLRAGAAWPSEHRSDFTERSRFLSAEAMLTALLFSLVIIGQWMSLLYYSPCTY